MNAGKTDIFEQNLLAQYLLIYELSAAEPELNEFIDSHNEYTKLSVSLKFSDTDSVSAFVNAIKKLNKQHTNIDLTATGLPVIYQSLVNKTVYDVILSGFLALLAISAIALLLFKSFKIVLILLIVNTLPYVIVMGIWGHLVGNITPQIAIVFAVTIGIVFDDSLYLVLKYIEERNNRLRWEVLLKTTMPAILMTTLAFAIGFYVTMLSNFIPTVIFGFLAGSVMLIALLLDLILLPILLNLFMSPDDELSV